ncbi:conserved hypothetical protein [Ricinus communis]|uniref:Uncharacterized protein n=1 Tax=Ricinus communis TaxID=3988 RepID=B9TEG5_RICCO|nr:conserved hypothetical protein [Ricinus communis]
MLMKDGVTNTCVRKNFVQTLSSVQGWSLGSYDQHGHGFVPANNEWCYNTVVSSGPSMAFNINYLGDSPLTLWAYRNTVVGASIHIRYVSTTNGPFNIENNVIQASAQIDWEAMDSGASSRLVNTGTECQKASGVVDANYLLTGAYRTNYLGQRGAEIA